MFPLAEGMAGPLACDSELDVCANEVITGVDDLGAGHLGLEATHAGAAPSSTEGAEAKLGDRLERRERRATHQQGVLAPCQR